MHPLLLLALLASAASAAYSSNNGGSCARAARCCAGRDSSCYVRAHNGYGRTCYCDEGCLETGDCCGDYQDVCAVKVVDCELTAWSEWSECDTSCGRGLQKRTRLVRTHPSPSGRKCDPLEQKRVCQGDRCDRRYRHYKSPIRETAGLLPAKYIKNIKQVKSKWDVRENLFEHKKNMIKKSKYNSDANLVADDDTKDYQSDQPYGYGGLDDFQNNEIDVGSNDYCTVFELVRVTKACKNDKDFFRMQKGRRMCALCPEDARRESLGGRCRGHGVDSQLTRWRSTVHPKCHGKWRRLYEAKHCPCGRGNPDFVFV